MTAVMILGMLNTIQEMGREFVRPELEKRLGHPANELDWRWYETEKTRKAGQVSLNNRWQPVLWGSLVAPLWQLARDFEIIHDFVWE